MESFPLVKPETPRKACTEVPYYYIIFSVPILIFKAHLKMYKHIDVHEILSWNVNEDLQ